MKYTMTKIKMREIPPMTAEIIAMIFPIRRLLPSASEGLDEKDGDPLQLPKGPPQSPLFPKKLPMPVF
jgi:hypothetical protein